jgi:hypothetical protein
MDNKPLSHANVVDWRAHGKKARPGKIPFPFPKFFILFPVVKSHPQCNKSKKCKSQFP